MLSPFQPPVGFVSDDTKFASPGRWYDASHFHRDHPVLEQMGQALGMSSDDLDQLFIAAAQIV